MVEDSWEEQGEAGILRSATDFAFLPFLTSVDRTVPDAIRGDSFRVKLSERL